MTFNTLTQKPAYTFKRWTRKPYAVFRSLKIVVNIGVLANVANLLAVPQKGYAQTDTITINQHIDIEEVVVSSSRTEVMYNEVSRMVTIVPKEVMATSPAQSLNELLKSVTGIDIRQRGTQGVQSDVSIRGGSFEQTLILLNGIPLNDPQTGHHNLNLPIDFENIERIEVLYGPGTRAYGPNAFTGAVNIITNQAGKNQLKANLSGGQHGLYNANAAINYNTGLFNHYLSLGAKGSDGYKPNTDFTSQNVFYRGTLNVKDGSLSAMAGYLNKAFGAQDFYSQKYAEQFEQVRQLFGALQFNQQLGDANITVNVYGKQNHDRFELFREDKYHYQNGFFVTDNHDTAKYYSGIYAPWNYYSKHNYHMTNVLGGNAGLNFKSIFGNTAIGFDLRSEEIFSNVLGTASDTIEVPGEDRGQFTKHADREIINGFFEHRYNHEFFDISAGLLVHNSNDYGTFVNGGGELAAKFSSGIHVFGSVNQALRLPTFTDLYYNGPSNVGNPDLKPEKSLTYEFGGRYMETQWQIQSAVFYRQTRDAIDWVKYPSQAKYSTTNFTQLNTTGFEVNGRFLPEEASGISQLVDFVELGYAFNHVDKVEQDSSVSAYALDYLKNKLTFATQINLYKGFGFRVDASYNDRNGSYTNVNSVEVDYKPYFLLDARIFYKQNAFMVYADANNILNKTYEDIGGVVQPGIWIKAGINLTLGL